GPPQREHWNLNRTGHGRREQSESQETHHQNWLATKQAAMGRQSKDASRAHSYLHIIQNRKESSLGRRRDACRWQTHRIWLTTTAGLHRAKPSKSKAGPAAKGQAKQP